MRVLGPPHIRGREPDSTQSMSDSQPHFPSPNLEAGLHSREHQMQAGPLHPGRPRARGLQSLCALLPCGQLPPLKLVSSWQNVSTSGSWAPILREPPPRGCRNGFLSQFLIQPESQGRTLSGLPPLGQSANRLRLSRAVPVTDSPFRSIVGGGGRSSLPRSTFPGEAWGRPRTLHPGQWHHPRPLSPPYRIWLKRIQRDPSPGRSICHSRKARPRLCMAAPPLDGRNPQSKMEGRTQEGTHLWEGAEVWGAVTASTPSLNVWSQCQKLETKARASSIGSLGRWWYAGISR